MTGNCYAGPMGRAVTGTATQEAEGSARADGQEPTPADHHLTYLLWQAHMTSLRALEAALDRFGLTVSQYGALRFLADEGPLCAADLARRQGIRPQSVAAGIPELETRGFVRRQPHPEHGRMVLVGLEPRGRAALGEAEAAVTDLEQRLVDDLSPRQRVDLAEGLRRVFQRAAETSPAPAEASGPPAAAGATR